VTRPRHDPVRHFVGGALIGIGFMMMLLCGGCGAVFFVGILTDELRHATRMDAGILLMPIILGGVPAAVGLGLFVGGRSLRRRSEVSGDGASRST
jgi:hypothetical protein